MAYHVDMTGSRDMTAPNWKRTAGRLRKLADELRAHDFQVIEPPNFDVPPGKRNGFLPYGP